MHIHLHPVMYTGYGYPNPGGFENRRPYDLVFSVFMLGNGRARVFATHGELDRKTVVNIANELREKGVHTVLVERHGIEEEWSTGRATAHPKAKTQ